MLQIIVIILSLIATAVTFYSALLAWGILLLPFLFLLVSWLEVRQRIWPRVPALSDAANEVLQRYGHAYAQPAAARDFSATASTLMYAGAVLGLIGAVRGFWWGVAFGAANWVIMGLLAREFNPVNFIRSESLQRAHNEIVDWLMRQDHPMNPVEAPIYETSNTPRSPKTIPDDAKSYCPSCLATYTLSEGTCPDCDGVKLVPIDPKSR